MIRGHETREESQEDKEGIGQLVRQVQGPQQIESQKWAGNHIVEVLFCKKGKTRGNSVIDSESFSFYTWTSIHMHVNRNRRRRIKNDVKHSENVFSSDLIQREVGAAVRITRQVGADLGVVRGCSKHVYVERGHPVLIVACLLFSDYNTPKKVSRHQYPHVDNFYHSIVQKQTCRSNTGNSCPAVWNWRAWSPAQRR